MAAKLKNQNAGCYADFIIHVVDSSNPDAPSHMHVVYETLKKLGVKDKPVITLFNKSDMASDVILKDLNCDKYLNVSAKTGEGLDAFIGTMEKLLLESKVSVETVIGYKDAGVIDRIRKDGTLLEEKYLPEGIGIKAYISKELYGKIKSIIE